MRRRFEEIKIRHNKYKQKIQNSCTLYNWTKKRAGNKNRIKMHMGHKFRFISMGELRKRMHIRLSCGIRSLFLLNIFENIFNLIKIKFI